MQQESLFKRQPNELHYLNFINYFIINFTKLKSKEKKQKLDFSNKHRKERLNKKIKCHRMFFSFFRY